MGQGSIHLSQYCLFSSLDYMIQDGKQQVEYMPEQRGLYRLEVTYGAHHVANSPYSLAVVVEDGLPAEHNAGHSFDQTSVRSRRNKASMPTQASPLIFSFLFLQPLVVDLVAEWGQIAKTLYAVDGDWSGWEENIPRRGRRRETPDEKYIRENPHAPVVTRLEDVYKVCVYERGQRPGHRPKLLRVFYSMCSLFLSFYSSLKTVVPTG